MNNKSRLQTYGKAVIISMVATFAVCLALCAMPWIDGDKARVIMDGYVALLASVSSIMGLTIARYGVRETALSLKGGYRAEMRVK